VPVAAHALPPPGGPSQHTNIGLIVTNRRMSWASLQRLAVRVHTSMGRGSSTSRPPKTATRSTRQYAGGRRGCGLPLDELYIATSEAIWDAILASVLDEPEFDHPTGVLGDATD